MPRKGGRGPRQPLSQKRPGATRRIPVAVTSKGPRPGAASRIPRKSTKAVPAAALPTGRKRKGAAKGLAPAALAAHAGSLWDGLAALYPDAHCELDYRDAWQLLVATILSAQCTDKRVNMVTPALFGRWPGPIQLAAAPQEDVEEVIRTTGFFRNKARNLIAMANDLVLLPGVGRKTANVVLGNALGINEGVVVDTHVQRLAARLGLTTETDPEKIERVLMGLFPRDRWTLLSHLLIWHGRRVCDARRPRCHECTLVAICPSAAP